jgi:hypothetical protein
MSICDYIKCGTVIVFDTFFVKNRKAFCIDYNIDDQIIYKGFFGLKVINKSTFCKFAKIKDIYDYLDRDMSDLEKKRLKIFYKKAKTNMNNYNSVMSFVDYIYRESKILVYINNEKTSYENGKK